MLRRVIVGFEKRSNHVLKMYKTLFTIQDVKKYVKGFNRVAKWIVIDNVMPINCQLFFDYIKENKIQLYVCIHGSEYWRVRSVQELISKKVELLEHE
jgi:hypothetical protein